MSLLSFAEMLTVLSHDVVPITWNFFLGFKDINIRPQEDHMILRMFQDHTRDNKPSDTPTHFSLRECFELRLLLLSFSGHLLVFLVSINKVYEHLTHDRH